MVATYWARRAVGVVDAGSRAFHAAADAMNSFVTAGSCSASFLGVAVVTVGSLGQAEHGGAAGGRERWVLGGRAMECAGVDDAAPCEPGASSS